jgi:probable phosphoglycerate mutase
VTARIWLLRHGETEWTISGRHTGRTDIQLTDAGREEARAAGERIAGMRFDRVITSPISHPRDGMVVVEPGAAPVRAAAASTGEDAT